jgi:hypothetical protein
MTRELEKRIGDLAPVMSLPQDRGIEAAGELSASRYVFQHKAKPDPLDDRGAGTKTTRLIRAEGFPLRR